VQGPAPIRPFALRLAAETYGSQSRRSCPLQQICIGNDLVADKPDPRRCGTDRRAGQSFDSSDAQRRGAYFRKRSFVPARMTPIVTGRSPQARQMTELRTERAFNCRPANARFHGTEIAG